MFKKHKKTIILSSITILLPILFGLLMWNQLPENMTTHWNIHEESTNFSPKICAIFFPPVFLLITHLICIVAMSYDHRKKEQSPKIYHLILWIIPCTSLIANAMIYSTALGKNYNHVHFIYILLACIFLFFGNYLPKIKQNKTVGIRISWTMQNEENWNKTHRFGGKIWVICGIVLFIALFLPGTISNSLLIISLLCAVFCPLVYSYHIYRQHQREGIHYDTLEQTKVSKKWAQISNFIIFILTIAVIILLFTGKIQATCTGNSLVINASYWTDIELTYDEIDNIEYREDFNQGSRTWGFGSPTLSMGIFQNQEFPSYTLYAYTKAKDCILIQSEEKNLVIGLKNNDETKNLYLELLQRIDPTS